MMELFIFLLFWHVAGMSWLLYRYGSILLACWREPMLARPMLYFESDDWGPPGPEQSVSLQQVADILRRYRDREGNPVRMTIGLVLAAPRPGIPPGEWSGPDAATAIDASEFAPLRRVLSVHADCLVPQLHGWMHCWPPAVARAAEMDAGIAKLAGRVSAAGFQVLPSPLQSRWADCSSLPCRPVEDGPARREARREAGFFLGRVPNAQPVAVPPTFVWNEAVEQGWRAAGIRVLVTPGHRQCTRDEHGNPQSVGQRLYNGQRLPSGLRVLVRNVFFEPGLGHTPDDALVAVRRQWRLARPALLETHRFNFEGERIGENLARLEEFIERLLKVEPETLFPSPLELLQRFDSERERIRGRGRLRVWALRVWAEWPLRRKLWITGGVIWLGLARLLAFGCRRHDRETHGAIED